MKIHLSFALAAALSLVGAQSAHAYDFAIGNQTNEWTTVNYVSVHTVSALCHDRTPVDLNQGDPPLKFESYVRGSTAPGCLIDQVQMYSSTYAPKSWSGLGVGGGNFSLMPTSMSDGLDAEVCPYDNTCTDQ